MLLAPPSAHSGVEPAPGARQRCGQMGECRRRRRLAQAPAFAPDRQQPGGRWCFVRDVGVHLQHRGGAHRVAGEAGVADGDESGEAAGRRRVERGVDEEHPPSSPEVERMLDLELEVGEAFDAGQPPPLHRLGEQRAEGVVAAAKDVGLHVPLVVRLEGTNVALGKKILAESGLPIVSADNLADAADKVVKAVKGAK